MDVALLRSRLLGLTVLAALAGPAQAAVATPAPTLADLQAQGLNALTALADNASPENVPDRETLVTAMMIAMDVANPDLVPKGDAGVGALDHLRTVCHRAGLATVQLVRLARATPDPEDTLPRLSVALDRTTVMGTLCDARQLDIQSRELLKRGLGAGDAAELEAMRKMAEGMQAKIVMLVLGSTLTDLNPNSRTRTAADALPVLREAASAMPPVLRKETLDAIEKAMQKHDPHAGIDREVGNRLSEPFKGDTCTASCKVLGVARAGES